MTQTSFLYEGGVADGEWAARNNKKAMHEMLPVFVKRPQRLVYNKCVFWLVFIVKLKCGASLACLSSFLFDPLSRPDSLFAD